MHVTLVECGCPLPYRSTISLHQRAEFEVGGKKPVKFDGRDVLYNVWCISMGKGTDVSRGDICLLARLQIFNNLLIFAC